MTKKQRVCKDCKAEERTGPKLNAPYPGPRCHRHWYIQKKATANANAARRRASVYGISEEQYEALVHYQGGGCAGCGRPPGKRRLAVDHDHECCPGHNSCGNCVRGALCWSCNKYLNHIGDDPAILERLAGYLRNPPARIVFSNSVRVN